MFLGFRIFFFFRGKRNGYWLQSSGRSSCSFTFEVVSKALMKQPLLSNSRAGCRLTSGLWYVLPDHVCGLMPRDWPYNMQHTVPGWWVYRQPLNSQLCRTSPPEGAFVCLPEVRQVLWAKASTAGCPLPDCSLSVLPIDMINAASILYGGCHHSRHWGITKALISLLAWPCRPSHPSVE